ncbi:MAG: glutamate synthase-related protein, partial [Pseudomonadota bacterium]
RGFMFALGCIQALKCDQNTCPTGITTHKKTLQRGLDPKRKEVRVAHYVEEMVHGVETLALSCGMSDPRDLDRGHVRIVGDDGRSKKLNEVWPEVAA